MCWNNFHYLQNRCSIGAHIEDHECIGHGVDPEANGICKSRPGLPLTALAFGGRWVTDLLVGSSTDTAIPL